MKLAHNINLRTFCKEQEDDKKVLDALLSLLPVDLEKEKIKLDKRTAIGFNEKIIKIFEITLEKDKHINGFLKNLKVKLNQDQKELLARQAESRLDAELNFFIRLDKDKLLNNEYWVTDSGDCFHIKINVAAFPRKREFALKLIKEMLRTQ